MKLERLEVELRPRSAWEGVDLGLALLQRWRAPVFAAWCATFLPLAAVILFAPWGNALIGLAVLWWLKPLFERTVVHVLSRAMFGAAPSAFEVLSELRTIWWRGLARTLTWRRLTTTRALLQPVEMLEGVRGAERRRRENAVGVEAFGVITLVSLLGWCFERAIEVALLGLLVFATPAEWLPSFDGLVEEGPSAVELGWLSTAFLIAHLVAYSAGATLHAAAGFGLYLQRRTEAEGWDIEVAFRRLGARVGRERGTASRKVVALLVSFAALAGGSRAASTECGASQELSQELPRQSSPESSPDVSPASALDGAGDSPSKDAADAIERVLAREEFDTKTRDSELSFDFDFDLDWLFGRGGDAPGLPLLSAVLEVLAWLLAGAVVLGLVYLVVRNIALRDRERETARPAPPTHVFGLDVRPESLPNDVPSEALALWRRGEARAALGLLYRAAIARLIRDDGLELELSDTENDCLRRAHRAAPASRAAYFARITQAWLVCAYARSLPADSAVESLCGDWRAHFATEARR
jgi:hypothetical protein